MNAIVDAFDRLWRETPARPLIHLPSDNTTLTADDLQRTRAEYRKVLAAFDIGEAHVIVAVVGNRPGFLPLLLAAWSLDAVVMPVDEDVRPHELDDLVMRFGAAAIVRARSKTIPGTRHLDAALSIEVRPRHSWRPCPGLALLKLTSGSSGVPKAVGVPPVALINDAAHITEGMGIRPDDTQIAVIPLSHSYGFGNLVLPLLLQGTAIVLREAFVPQAVLADARSWHARLIPGVPFMFQHFATHPPSGGWPPSLTYAISAGAKLTPEVARAFWDRFGVKIHSFYGTSESGGITFDHSDTVDDLATVGWALPGVAIELRDDLGVPEGCGRVIVRSSALAPGYVRGSTDDRDLNSDGFLTADYGRLLNDGRLLLAGRVSSFINVAGRKVQPSEIEQELRAIPGVTEVRVLSVADSVRGEQVAAVVAGSDTLSQSAIRRFCSDRLSPHKIPRVIVVVPALPLTARGKIDTRALQALVNAQLT